VIETDERQLDTPTLQTVTKFGNPGIILSYNVINCSRWFGPNNRHNWDCVFTSHVPATDGFQAGSQINVPMRNAHLNNEEVSYLGLARPGGGTNGSINNLLPPLQVQPSFVIDLRYPMRFNALSWTHRQQNNTVGMWWWTIRVWGTNDYKGPFQHINPAISSGVLNPDYVYDTETEWTELGIIDFRNDLTVTPPAPSFTPNRLSPLFPLEEGVYRWIKVGVLEWGVANQALCLSAIYLHYSPEHIELPWPIQPRNTSLINYY